VIRPKVEDEEIDAKREAVLKPRIFGEFLRNYDGNQFPRQDIALNVLEHMGVPRDKTEEVLERISESARSVGFVEELKGKYYVQLDGKATGTEPMPVTGEANLPVALSGRTNGSDDGYHAAAPETPPRVLAPPPITHARGAAMAAALADDQRRRRVFITHGKNRALVDPIKKLLEYGELVLRISQMFHLGSA
jgi:hypothetical protein